MYGTRNSTCKWNLPPNFSLVMMLPVPLTCAAPPSTSFHAAGLLPSSLVQLSRLLPSKRTTAPEGGGVPLTSCLSSGLATVRPLMSQVLSLAAETVSRVRPSAVSASANSQRMAGPPQAQGLQPLGFVTP